MTHEETVTEPTRPTKDHEMNTKNTIMLRTRLLQYLEKWLLHTFLRPNERIGVPRPHGFLRATSAVVRRN